jgi:hypothetical protein
MSKGLDGRHRDANGQISEKHGNTLVRTIRAEYGENKIPGFRSDAKLSTVRAETGKSLTQLIQPKSTRR